MEDYCSPAHAHTQREDVVSAPGELEQTELWRALSDEIESNPVLPWCEKSWAAIEDSPKLGSRVKCALRLVAGGLGYRKAAAAVQYSDHSQVYRTSRRFGLAEANSDELVGQSRRIAHLSGTAIEDRIVDDPESLGIRDLAVVNGISLDKVARREGWGKEVEDSPHYASALDQLAEEARKGNIKMTLHVEPVQPRTPGTPPPGELLDVTPEDHGGH